ncbi:hypothetical protein N566_12570 [Streptomycetaceae bacterium MP113-05]|nr:hypothetical protein N566_12570 [Streptomycetaceae bacterium MP113-05]
MSELTWFKSSYSDSSGGECVEVAGEWTKSSYSDSGGGDCVEVAATLAAVHVRDSKDRGGPTLCITSEGWGGFVAAL